MISPDHLSIIIAPVDMIVNPYSEINEIFFAIFFARW